MKFDRRLTDKIYTSDTVRLGKNAFQAMRETIYHNGGVGTITAVSYTHLDVYKRQRYFQIMILP